MQQNYKKLKLWEVSLDLAEEVYQVLGTFPKEENFGLAGQLRRSSTSICCNIAEGAGRDTNKQFAYFLSIAQGSAFEVETQLILAERLKLTPKGNTKKAMDLVTYVQKMNYNLKKTLLK